MRFDDAFAIRFIDRALRDNPATPAAQARTESFAGALQQGFERLGRNGRRAAGHALYTVVDAQVQVPHDAEQRGGIRPVVALTANGAVRADVAVGEAVAFEAAIAVPPNAGKEIAAEWDFEGAGVYPLAETGKNGAPDRMKVRTGV